MILKYIATSVQNYNRLKIELDLLESEIGKDFPIISLVSNYLKYPPYNIQKFKKEIKVYYEQLESKDN